jgi:signal transduction histidine kinase
MKIIKKIALLCITSLSLAGLANAQTASKGSAEASVKKAIAFAKANGKEKAIAACNTGNFFVKGDGYIFAYSPTGVNVCHKNEKMRGKNLLDMKDANGVLLIQEMLKACTSSAGNGWIKYVWPHPVTKAVEPKTSYVEKSDDLCWASGFSKN